MITMGTMMMASVVRNEYDQINNMPKVVAEKTDIPNVIMKIQVARQKQRRRRHSGNHAGAMRGNLPAHNQAAADDQQYGAGSVQTGDKGRVEGVLLSDHILAIIL